MTKKKLIIFVMVSVLSFGVYPLVVWWKAKRPTPTGLSRGKKVVVNTKRLKSLLQEKNITGVEYTHKKIKIFLKSTKNLDLESIKKLRGITSVFASEKYLTLVVGNTAKELAQQLL